MEMVELAEDNRGDIRGIAYVVAKRSGRWAVDHVTIQKDFFEKGLVESGKLVQAVPVEGGWAQELHQSKVGVRLNPVV